MRFQVEILVDARFANDDVIALPPGGELCAAFKILKFWSFGSLDRKLVTTINAHFDVITLIDLRGELNTHSSNCITIH